MADRGQHSGVKVFNYTDYRKFLDEYYRHAKKNFGYFSYRWFARKAGYTSSGLYANIVKGIKNLTPKYLRGFIAALGLSPTEAEFFRLMVKFDRAGSRDSRQEVYEEMIKLLPKKTRRLLSGQKELYTKWYHSAVLQALNVLSIKNNLKDLCHWIVPRIRIVEARQSVHLLEELGLITRDQEGCWRPSQLDLVGGKEVGALYIHNFQLAMLEKAREALTVTEPRRRYYITETFSVSRECRRRVQTKTKEFHREIIDLIVNDGKQPEELFQMNVQLFPLCVGTEHE